MFRRRRETQSGADIVCVSDRYYSRTVDEDCDAFGGLRTAAVCSNDLDRFGTILTPVPRETVASVTARGRRLA